MLFRFDSVSTIQMITIMFHSWLVLGDFPHTEVAKNLARFLGKDRCYHSTSYKRALDWESKSRLFKQNEHTQAPLHTNTLRSFSRYKTTLLPLVVSLEYHIVKARPSIISSPPNNSYHPQNNCYSKLHHRNVKLIFDESLSMFAPFITRIDNCLSRDQMKTVYSFQSYVTHCTSNTSSSTIFGHDLLITG